MLKTKQILDLEKIDDILRLELETIIFLGSDHEEVIRRVLTKDERILIRIAEARRSNLPEDILGSERVELFMGEEIEENFHRLISGNLNRMALYEEKEESAFYKELKGFIPLLQFDLGKESTRREKVSGCLITLNEQEYIGRCLDNFIELVDEVIIVDGGSTDRTLEIARGYPDVKIIHHPMPHDFSQQRNVYLREAGFEWILSIDADEVFEPALRSALPHLTGEKEFSSYWFPRKAFYKDTRHYLTSHNSYPDYQPRLFRNQPGVRYEGRIHEKPYGMRGNQGMILDINILHHCFLKPEDEIRERFKKYDLWGGGGNHLSKLEIDYEAKAYEGPSTSNVLRVIDDHALRRLRMKLKRKSLQLKDKAANAKEVK